MTCILAVKLTVINLFSPGGTVTVRFAETDVASSEDSSRVSAPVRVEGDNEDNITVIAIPLTLAQYQAQPGTYANSCDSIFDRDSVDPAECKSILHTHT